MNFPDQFIQQLESKAKRNDELEAKGISINKKLSKSEKEKIDRARPFILGAAKRKREDDESSVSSEECEFTDDDQEDVNDNESFDSEKSIEESDANDFLATDDEVNDSDNSDFGDDPITRRRVDDVHDSGSDDSVSIGFKGPARKRICINESSGEESDVEPSKEKKRKQKQQQKEKEKRRKQKQQHQKEKNKVKEQSTTKPTKEQQQTIEEQQTMKQQRQSMAQQHIQQPIQSMSMMPESPITKIKQLQKQQKRQEIRYYMAANRIDPINDSDRKWVDNLMGVSDYYIDYGHQLIRRRRLDPYIEDWACTQHTAIVNGDILNGSWKYALLAFIRFVVEV